MELFSAMNLLKDFFFLTVFSQEVGEGGREETRAVKNLFINIP